MATNDARIMQLQDKVETKREELAKKSSKFVPITTCAVEFDGKIHNLNVLTKAELKLLACRLQALNTSAIELGFTVDEVVISGFTIEDWMTDTMSRVNILEVKEEQAALKQMEAKLKTLLSSDKKTELELDAIEAML